MHIFSISSSSEIVDEEYDPTLPTARRFGRARQIYVSEETDDNEIGSEVNAESDTNVSTFSRQE